MGKLEGKTGIKIGGQAGTKTRCVPQFYV